MQPETTLSYLSSNHERLLSQIASGWSSVHDKGVCIATPFFYEKAKDRISGKINIQGREIPIYYLGNSIHSSQNLEKCLNLDIAVVLFNKAVDNGQIRTKHLFKSWTSENNALFLVVSTKQNFEDYTVIQLSTNLEDLPKRIYDFATGKLHVKELDDEIDAVLDQKKEASRIAQDVLNEIRDEKKYFPVSTLPSNSLPLCQEFEAPIIWLDD